LSLEDIEEEEEVEVVKEEENEEEKEVQNESFILRSSIIITMFQYIQLIINRNRSLR
jgi:hypothetical protein